MGHRNICGKGVRYQTSLIRQAPPAELTQALLEGRGNLPLIEACLCRVFELARHGCIELVNSGVHRAVVAVMQAHCSSSMVQQLGCECLAQIARHDGAAIWAAGGAEAAIAASRSCSREGDNSVLRAESIAVLHSLFSDTSMPSPAVAWYISATDALLRALRLIFGCVANACERRMATSAVLHRTSEQFSYFLGFCWAAGGLATAFLSVMFSVHM